jgi:DNA gyrase subunit A
MTIRFNETTCGPWAATPPACGASACEGRRRGGLLRRGGDDTDILIVTDAGYGKRTKLERFNRQARGGQGCGHPADRQARLGGGRLHGGLDEEILLVSSGGVVIRTAAREIASQGRDATGVRVMNLDDGQSVAAVARVTRIASG